MAAVYEATHRNGNRVAIKLLHPELSCDGDVRDRFLREGYAANKVDHAGAVTVLDDDETDDGAVFLVMELLDGEPLATRLERKGSLDPSEVLFIGDQILDVLASAHARGVIHRDLKPANLFLTRDRGVKVLDFGLARVRESTFQGDRTRDGIVIGTVSYMAPEQAQGKNDRIDARSDLWAVGAVMFTALTGRIVHEGGSTVERLMAAMKNPAPSLASVAPHLPDALVAYIDRCLAFEKDDRFPGARAMQSAGRAVFSEIAGQPIPSLQRFSMAAAWNVGDVAAGGDVTAADPTDVAVSVVFEPEGGGSVVLDLQPKVTFADDAAPSLVTDSMIADIEDVPETLASRAPVKPGRSK